MTRWKWTLLACCASLTLTAAEFTPDGVIEGKSGKIMIDQRNRFDFLDNGGSIAAFLSGSNPEGKWFSTGDLKEVKRSLDPAKRSVTVTGIYPATGDSPAIPVEYSLALLPDGRTARVSIAFQSEAVRQGFNLYFAFRFGYRDFMKERHVSFDGKEISCAFDRAQRQRVPFYNGKAKECVFNLPEDNSLLKFTLVNGDHAELVQDWNKESKTHDSLDFVLGFPKDGKLVFDLDLDSLPEQAANSYRVGEMEFGPNKFRLPDYTLCRNLVQNPSFEDGLYFWADRPTGSAKDVAMPREYPFVVDETTAAHGKRSFRQLLAPGLISYLATFAIPVKAKTKYTLSFYAKTDAKTTFDLNLSGWTQARGPYLSEGGFCAVTKDWKRYSKTFTTPNKLAQIALMHNYGGPDPAYLWIDAVQLEEGDKSTDFTMNPVSAVFETYSQMNLFQPGDVMLPRFRVASAQAVEGVISYRVKDIFKRIVKAGKIDFKTSGDFTPSYVDIPEMPDLGAGTYAVEADLRTADFKNTLYYRFTLMPFMTGAFKHRRLFCGSMGCYIGTTPRDLEAMAKAGVGSQIIFQPPTKALRDLLKVHDMLFSSTIFSSDGIDTDNFCHNFMSKYDLALPAENGILSVKDEALPLFEERAYRFAKRNPEVKYWKLVNEPVHNRDEEVKRSIEVLAHTCKGIRRATPDAVIFTPDPPGIGPVYLHKFWNMGGKDLCDAVATHPYRVHPESPDLDKDIADLLKGLPKNVPVYFTEGNYFGMYELPENSIRAFGNDKTLCNDFYRAGHFTYDIGLGELAAVAHRMRYRLQVMKYADRVLWDDDWGLQAQTVAFGLDVVPNGILFSVNTPASLLGNADFKSDIVFGEPIRCYLFEDDQRRPVAVIWNYNGEIFQRPEMVSKLDLSGMKEKFEVFNLMGAKEKVPRDNLLPVDGCPLFLRGEAGKTAEFQKQLGALDMVGGTAPDFKIETSIDRGRLNMRIRNVRAKDKAGLLTITADGEELLSRRVELPAAGEFPFAAEIPASAALKRMKDVITLKADGKSPVEKVYELEYFDVKQVGADFKADGTLGKWQGIAPVKLSTFVTFGANPQDPKQREYLTASVPHRGDKDLSAEIRAAYNKDFLHLLVKVTDDVYHPVDTPVAGSYNGDGLQIYFDSFADARNVEPHGFGDDDQAYDIRCLDGKTVEASRSYAPYAQLAFTRVGMDKSVQGTFKKTEDGYLFDLAFPLRAILPIELAPGKGVGISILVNDNDNDYRKRGVQLNRGAEPFQRPELYPVMMFK